MVLKSILNNHIKPYKWAWILVLIFTCIYSLESIGNHFSFRTYALDLGAYTNALYDYAHLQFNDKGVFKDISENLLSDHFDLYLIFFAPFAFIFGQYTLLIFQIAFIVAGGIGVYRFLLLKFQNQQLAMFGLLSFYLFFALYSALSFDYHSNVISAMLAPWVFLNLHKGKKINFFFLLLAMMIGKESVSLWTFFLCLGLMIEYRKDKDKLKTLLFGALFSVVYFIVILKLVMPSLANSGKYEHYKFHALGQDYNSAFKFIFTHPIEFIKTLFVNHSTNPSNDWVKTEFYIFTLVSGGLLLFFRPAYLLMLWPVLVMKMCYDEPSAWSIDCHYSIEFAPLVVIGAFTVIAELRSKVKRNLLIAFCVLGSAMVTYRLMNQTVYWHDSHRMRFYHAHHYGRAYNTQLVRERLAAIPDTAIVAAQTPLLPHIAFRDHCYQLPKVKDAEYIVIAEQDDATYPVSMPELKKQMSDSLNSGRWEIVFMDKDLSMIKRK